VVNKTQFNLSLLQSPDRKRLGDPIVDDLFNQYIRGQGNINSHKFRERIFKAALSLFAGRDFYFWYQAQKASHLYGDYKKRYLEDTLLYLFTGKRELSVTSWSTLITISSTIDQPGEQAPIVSEFFNEKNRENGTSGINNHDIIDILQLWWSKPAGVGDLLYTLHILFGNIN